MYEKSLMQLEEEYDCGSVFFFFDAKRTRTSNMLKCMSLSIYPMLAKYSALLWNFKPSTHLSVLIKLNSSDLLLSHVRLRT